MIIKVLQYLVPDCQCVVLEDPANATEYHEQVVWLDARPQPSWSQVENVIDVVRKNVERDEAANQRRTAYAAEADSLFFEWQRGEGTEQAWRDKVEEIRQRYPYPT